MHTRRRFLMAAGGLAAAAAVPDGSAILRAAPGAASELGKVKITGVKTASIQLTYYPAHLVKVTTDAGIDGIGEAYNRAGVLEHIRDIGRVIIGKDPLQVDVLWHAMMEAGVGMGSRSGSLAGAISGIESALLDLTGKILGVPVHVLLGGGFRDRVLIYHDAGAPNVPDPKPWVEEAKRSKAFGFRAFKFDLNRFGGDAWNRAVPLPDLKAWARILDAIRGEIGSDVPLGVDFHWKSTAPDVLRFARMVEDLDLWFLEDPIPPENADAFARLCAECPIPIATGENLFTRQTFRPFIERQACDIIQPDTQKCGGLMELKRIADWADLYEIGMVCHNMCTPVGTIASAHACAAIRSFQALESDSVELPFWQDLIRHDGPIYRDGYLRIPTGPGLGIELDEEICRKHLASGSGFFE